MRPLAVGCHLSDQCVEAMIEPLGLSHSDLCDLREHLCQPSAIELAGAPPHVINLFQAIHQDTWFVMDDQQEVVRTELGSRPGDGFADVVFGLLWGKLLRKLEQDLVTIQVLDCFLDQQGL